MMGCSQLTAFAACMWCVNINTGSSPSYEVIGRLQVQDKCSAGRVFTSARPFLFCGSYSNNSLQHQVEPPPVVTQPPTHMMLAWLQQAWLVR
jgi:hypothetical protein